jgi:alpha-L-fucosidase
MLNPDLRQFFVRTLPLLVTFGIVQPGRAAEMAPPTEQAKAEHDQRLAWFREAKYGLFIHWGLYALPAGEWKGQRSPGLGEWIMNRSTIPVHDYEQLATKFNPTKFDADAWVQMAVDAGMKYIVITAKHHDGFAMYHSKVSTYNIFDATPFKRDPIKELSAACAKRGMPFGFYYSQAQDWHEPGGAGNDWDFPSNAEKDKSGAYEKYLHEKAEPQVRELLQNYGPICLVWFDTPQLITKERGHLFADAVRSLQPKTLIDGRLGPDTPGDYESTGDNAIPNSNKQGDWETPATMNHTWGFRTDDRDWKSPGEILFKLVDITSKGGNYLLNVGPTAEGLIPQASQDNLRTVGVWLKRYGEAIYGAGRSPFGDEFGDYAAKLKDANGKPVFLARNEWRCTTKPGKLYFAVFKLGRDGAFELPAFKNAIKAAYMLDDPKRSPLPLKTGKDGVRAITLSRFDVNDTMGAVAVVEIEGDAVHF